jgi:transmembrane sensor
MELEGHNIERLVLDPSFKEWALGKLGPNANRWEKRLQQNPSMSPIMAEAREIVWAIHVHEAPVPKGEIAQAYQELMDKIEEQSYRPFRVTHKQPNRYKQNWRTAAVWIGLIFSTLGGTWLLQQQFAQSPTVQQIEGPKREWHTKEIPKGQKLTILLEDGTKIKLNAGSTLRYPKKFDEKTREIYLTGEAYLEVAKNPDRPFVIHTEEVDTRVLGTILNIRSYCSDNKVKVTLVEGKVEVVLRGQKQLLQPTETAVVDQTTGQFKIRHEDLSDILAWKNGVIVLKKANMGQIKDVLENWYGVNIQLGKQFDPAVTYTGKFENETLGNVLEAIRYTAKFDFDIQEKQVTIF